MEALLYHRVEDTTVRCDLCNHRCVIKDGKRGTCGVRENKGGVLESLVYARVIARHIDPIEKKPLFHFQPGTRTYSLATVGCNFRCLFCQNADISQMPRDLKRILGEKLPPDLAVKEAVASGCRSISYTYTEPTIFMEYALDTAKLGQAAGLKNIFVTNGYMSLEALELISPYLDGANVDLKSMRDQFYREQCGARLEPVLESIRTMKALGIWVEVTTLIIPTVNDSDEELTDIANFIKELDPGMPWHVSRFHPTYKLTHLPSTPVASVQRARELGLAAGLHYVYTGNVPGDPGEKTYCHACGTVLIDRYGFATGRYWIRHGSCPQCGARVPGIEM